MKSYSFLFWAYNVIWLGLAVYLWWMMSRLRQVGKRLEGIESRLSRAGQESRDS